MGSGDNGLRLMQKKKGKKNKIELQQSSSQGGDLIRNSSLSDVSVRTGHQGLLLRNALVPNSSLLFTFLPQTVAL